MISSKRKKEVINQIRNSDYNELNKISVRFEHKRGGRKPGRWTLSETLRAETVTVDTARNVAGGNRDGGHCPKRVGRKP